MSARGDGESEQSSARSTPIVFPSALALAAVLALGPLGCASGKREAASLVAAVDRYRQAEMGAKGARSDAIDAVPCADAEVCGAKEACLAASRPTAKGAALKSEVERSLADLHAGRISQEEAAARGLAQKLDLASRLLDEGYARLSACDAKVTALRLKYGL